MAADGHKAALAHEKGWERWDGHVGMGTLGSERWDWNAGIGTLGFLVNISL